MTETGRPSPAQDDWELIELIERREDLEKLLAVSQKAARQNPGLKKDFQAVIEKFRLYETLKVERGPGKVRLTLANLWRLTRYENRPGLFPEAFDPAEVTLEAFDLAEGGWKEQNEIHWTSRINPWVYKNYWLPISSEPFIWPDQEIEYHPRRRGRRISYFSLLSALVVKIFHALEIEIFDDLGRPTSRAHVFAKSLIDRFIKLPYKQPSQALEAALRRYILDGEVLSLLRPMHGDADISLSHYLTARAQRKHLARLIRETPNFLPLLNLIPSDWWARRDLLRDKVLRFANRAFNHLSAAGLRWLRRAPAKALVELSRNFSSYDDNRNAWGVLVIEVMAELSPWPGGAFWESCQAEIIDETTSLGLWLSISREKTTEFDPVSARRLVRTLARHILNRAVEKRRKLADLYEFCAGLGDLANLYDSCEPDCRYSELADWYEAEGRRQGLPDKNSTWASLQRRAEKWHEEIWQRKMAEAKNASWESLVGPLEIEGIKIKPLVTGLELYDEGREMKHCVVTYAPKCLNEGRRIFSLTEPDGKRSTLSLRPRDRGFVIDQHKGPTNARVSRAAARAAREICRLYTRRHQAGPRAA